MEIFLNDSDLSETDYRALTYNSSSSLKDFSLDRKKYHKKYILGERVREKENKSSNMGRIVETLALEPHRFDSLFFMSSMVKEPTGMLGDFIWKMSELVADGSTFEDAFPIAYEASGFKISMSAIANKLEKPDNQIFYEECLNVNALGMTLVTTDDVTNAERIVEKLKNAPNTSHIINAETSGGLEVWTQPKITNFDVYGINMKAMLDRVIINHSTKRISIYDLKCTWSVENFFKEYYLYRRAYIQALIYYKALKAVVEAPGSAYKGYEVELPQFVVCDSIGYYDPLVYRLTQEDLNDANDGFYYRGTKYPGLEKIIEDLKWAINTDRWGISRENSNLYGVVPLRDQYEREVR